MKTSVPTANRKPKNLNSNLIDGWTPGRSRDAGGAGLPIPAAAPATATPWNHDHTRNHGFRRPVLCSNFVQATPHPASFAFFAASHWRRASMRANGGTAGESGGEIGVHGLGDGLARPRPPLIRNELLEVGRIRDIAELDQHRRHVRRLE